MQPLLQIRNFGYSHPGGIKALSDINLTVFEGENLVLFGPNGSGKTTLLLQLNGTLRGTGEIRVAGVETSKENLPEIRRLVGILFQDADEQLFMPTVLEDVMFGPLNLRWSRERAEKCSRETLAAVGITSELFGRPPFHLSAGEKRRVALAGVLVTQPRLLLLDEPTTSLDPPGQRTLLQLLQKLPQTKLIATHDVKFAAAMSNRAIFLENGHIVADGEVKEIAQRFDWDVYP
jgi:cobalt/nickel transport system ATP-binding protein